MKLTNLILLFTIILLAGCASQVENPTPNPDAKLTARQQMEKTKNDPKIPDGLKQIQMNTLQHEPVKP